MKPQEELSSLAFVYGPDGATGILATVETEEGAVIVYKADASPRTNWDSGDLAALWTHGTPALKDRGFHCIERSFHDALVVVADFDGARLTVLNDIPALAQAVRDAGEEQIAKPFVAHNFGALPPGVELASKAKLDHLTPDERKARRLAQKRAANQAYRDRQRGLPAPPAQPEPPTTENLPVVADPEPEPKKVRKSAPAPELQDGEAIELGRISSTSGKIRYLADLGWRTADIARFLAIAYTFASNVVAAHKKGVKWIKRGTPGTERKRKVKSVRWRHEVNDYMRKHAKQSEQAAIMQFLRWLEGHDVAEDKKAS